MNNILVHAHSGLRYLVLLLIVIAIVNALISRGKDTYLKKDKMINLFAMIFCHIQLLIGLVLYFVSSKVRLDAPMANDQVRFFTLEHALMMILAIVLITIGRKRAEKAPHPKLKHTMIVISYTISLAIIFYMIPWKFIYSFGV